MGKSVFGHMRDYRAIVLSGALALLLAACGSTKDAPPPPASAASAPSDAAVHAAVDEAAPVATPAAAPVAAAAPAKPAPVHVVDVNAANKSGVGVNKYIWRAALDTLSFMPLLEADPFGGTIITDWHSNPATPNERLKVQAYILSKDLRADALTVTVFRQEYRQGTWVNASVAPDTKIKLENTILARARQLRVGEMD